MSFANRRHTHFPAERRKSLTRTMRGWLKCGWMSGKSFTTILIRVIDQLLRFAIVFAALTNNLILLMLAIKLNSNR